MDIHQLSAQYQKDQDRILMRFNTTSHEELRVWLTRVLLRGWWPHLRTAVAQLETRQHSDTPAHEREQQSRRRRAEVLAQADLASPFDESEATLPLGSAPLLLTEVSQQQRDDKLALSFVEKLQTEAPPRGFDLELELPLLHGLVHLLEMALSQTDWGLLTDRPDPTLGAAVEVEVEAAPDADADADADVDADADNAVRPLGKPRYLH